MLFGLLVARPPWTRHETLCTLPKFGSESGYGITHARNLGQSLQRLWLESLQRLR